MESLRNFWQDGLTGLYNSFGSASLTRETPPAAVPGNNNPLIYKPLPSSTSIRLLYLHPAELSEPNLLGSFSIVNLDSKPKYRALSYVWGHQTGTHLIKVDDHNVTIGKNLYEALRSTRSAQHEMLLWVDALCINQDKVLEKNHQVKIMGSIYKLAEEVLVWLGPADADYDWFIFEIVNCMVEDAEFKDEYAKALNAEISQGLKDVIQDPKSFSKDYTSWWSPHSREIEAFRVEESPVTSALRRFTCYEWFHRIWTFQEIGLATRAKFLIGQQQADWEVIYTAFKTIENNVYGGQSRLISYGFYTNRVTFLHEAYQIPSFRDLVVNTSERGGTEPRDKVFALLSHQTCY